MSDLNDFLKLVAEAKVNTPSSRVKKIEEQVKTNVKSDLSSLFEQLASVKTPQERLAAGEPVCISELPELQSEIAKAIETGEVSIQGELNEVTLPTPIGKVPPEAQIPDLDKYLKPKAETPKEEPLTNEFRQVNDKIKFLERWVSQIQNTGPGSGEVNFRYLDDVVRSTMNDGNDNWVLKYNASTRKVQFTKDIGPIDTITTETLQVNTAQVEGTLTVNDDTTINGNLTVNGDITYINTETLDVTDKNITVAKGAVDAASADGAGIHVDGSNANIKYVESADSWEINKSLIPSSDGVFDVGSSVRKWKEAHFNNGFVESINFDVTHVDDDVHEPGTLCWNADDMTLNLHHPQGSRQQIGQEQYYPPVRNLTGSDIADGTVVMFAGAEETNSSRLLISPMIANGTYPSLYTMGVVTAPIANGEHGFVTSFGYVNDIDTSMWNKGDLLYADPAVPGGMTNVKPTSPNACVVIAAVVHKHATLGRIMVRPTIEQRMMYGRFSDTTTHIPAATNTPYAITFDTSEVQRGFHRDGNGLPTSAITAEESGYYQCDATLSLTSTNSTSKAFYIWMRKNGVDIPKSARRQSVSGNGTYLDLNYHFTVSLNKNDYIQLMYAVDNTTIQIDAPNPTSFCPAIPSATLLITQVAL